MSLLPSSLMGQISHPRYPMAVRTVSIFGRHSSPASRPQQCPGTRHANAVPFADQLWPTCPSELTLVPEQRAVCLDDLGRQGLSMAHGIGWFRAAKSGGQKCSVKGITGTCRIHHI